MLGFSQGATLAYALAVLHPDLVRGAVPISGTLAPTLIPATWPAGQPRPPVLAFHGSQDPVFPVQRVRDTMTRLRQLGLEANGRSRVSQKLRRWEDARVPARAA